MPLSVRHERIPHFITRPLFSSLPRCHEAGRIASAVGKSHLSFCVGRCASLFGRSDLRERRTPPLARIRGVRSSGVCSASGASTYSAASGLNRTPTVLATPSVSAPFHLQPRRVRSNCRVSPAGRFELYFCGQFSVCLFRIRGREPRSIFPLAKVGLTVQRKTGPPGLSS